MINVSEPSFFICVWLSLIHLLPLRNSTVGHKLHWLTPSFADLCLQALTEKVLLQDIPFDTVCSVAISAHRQSPQCLAEHCWALNSSARITSDTGIR